MTRLTLIAAFIFSTGPALAQSVPCANYATIADTQAPIARELTRETKIVGNNPIVVREKDAQPAFDKLQASAKAVEEALNAYATAWEDVQIETSKCRILKNRAG